MKEGLGGGIAAHFAPRSVARTSKSHSGTSSERRHGDAKSDFFRSAEWTADGTTVIANSSDNDIRTFIIPPNVLEDREEPLSLVPYSKLSSREPVNAVTVYPLFNLQDPSTTLVLSSVRDHPVRLNSALATDLIASYPLIKPTTEAFITPHSLAFRKDGSRFVAGSDSLISVFDLSRPGRGPFFSVPTASKRNHSLTNPGMKMKGIVSALAVEEESGILAAGTFTRHVGLYDSGGMGECVGVFTIEGTEADKEIQGSGVNQLAWSACGRYLYIVERKSDGAMIYDIRQTGQLVAWLKGRRAMTNQRLGIDLVAVEGGHEVWAGGTDGRVRVWKKPHQQEGAVDAGFEWLAHNNAVSSADVHPAGGVVATSSGQRYSSPFEDESRPVEVDGGPMLDESLKIWAL